MLRTPKLGGVGAKSPNWYRYYPGYSPEFVRDVLDSSPSSGLRVLDPWNGAGTTTSVSYDRGLPAFGFDLNPALVLVAKGRLVGPEALQSLPALTNDLLDHAGHRYKKASLDADEPLRALFGPKTALHLRSLERSIFQVLVDPSSSGRIADEVSLAKVSNLASYFYVVLFDTTRSLVRSLMGSNPTWIRRPSESTRLGFTSSTIECSFSRAQQRLATYLASRPVTPQPLQTPMIDLATSAALPMADESVDIVLTSPPYCTRIDYAISTLPELLILGLRPQQVRRLRDGMIGTPTVTSAALDSELEAGQVGQFLKLVSQHPSKASSGYYLRYFKQYYASMRKSLEELRRVTRQDGRFVLVAQDSFYKDIHIDLPNHLAEMAASCGWRLHERFDYEVACTKAALNSGARKYRSTFTATETVLILN